MSQNLQNGLQSHPKMVFNKKTQKMKIFSTRECGSSVIRRPLQGSPGVGYGSLSSLLSWLVSCSPPVVLPMGPQKQTFFWGGRGGVIQPLPSHPPENIKNGVPNGCSVGANRDPKSELKSPKWVPKAIPTWWSKETSNNYDFRHPQMWLKCCKYMQNR